MEAKVTQGGPLLDLTGYKCGYGAPINDQKKYMGNWVIKVISYNPTFGSYNPIYNGM